MPTAKRGDLIDRFREDDSVQVFLSTDAGGVGLNLQSGSVLVNLDVPWNSAVLEQRNGRVHRLGQTRKVQIITMVAINSYEEHVLSLVQNKQKLFDNVISGDAGEDVVGVSNKLLETLLEDFPDLVDSEEKGAGQHPEPDQLMPDQVHGDTSQGDSTGEYKPDRTVEEAITRCIEELQKSFGARIERIVGSGGGLLVVLDRVDSEADRVVSQLSSELVPVAIIDLRTLNGLARLGSNSPIETSQTYYDASRVGGEQKISRLTALAEEKFQAAQVLVEQNLVNVAVEMLLSSLLAAAADQAALETSVSPQEAGVWLYSEALPKGLLTQQEVPRYQGNQS